MALLVIQIMSRFMDLLAQFLAFFRAQLGWTPLCLLPLTLLILAHPILLGRRIGTRRRRRPATTVPGLG